jgi:hypothetical protein
MFTDGIGVTSLSQTRVQLVVPHNKSKMCERISSAIECKILSRTFNGRVGVTSLSQTRVDVLKKIGV